MRCESQTACHTEDDRQLSDSSSLLSASAVNHLPGPWRNMCCCPSTQIFGNSIRPNRDHARLWSERDQHGAFEILEKTDPSGCRLRSYSPRPGPKSGLLAFACMAITKEPLKRFLVAANIRNQLPSQHAGMSWKGTTCFRSLALSTGPQEKSPGLSFSMFRVKNRVTPKWVALVNGTKD